LGRARKSCGFDGGEEEWRRPWRRRAAEVEDDIFLSFLFLLKNKILSISFQRSAFFRGKSWTSFCPKSIVSPSKLPCVLDPSAVEWHCSPVTVCDRCYSSSLKVEFRNKIMINFIGTSKNFQMGKIIVNVFH
jgi:hypothetical protein